MKAWQQERKEELWWWVLAIYTQLTKQELNKENSPRVTNPQQFDGITDLLLEIKSMLQPVMEGFIPTWLDKKVVSVIGKLEKTGCRGGSFN